MDPDQNTGGSDADLQLADPLAALGQVDMTTVSTAVPLLPAGLVRLRLDSIEVVDSKRVQGNKNMLVIFKTVAPIMSFSDPSRGIAEQELKEEWQVRQYYPLQHNDEAKAAIERGETPTWDYRQNIARLLDACEGTTQETRNPFDANRLLNKHVMAKIVVEEMDDGSGMLTNSIKALSHPVD